MSKILDLDFRNGSLIDKVSGTVMTVTGSPVFKDTEKGKGIYFNGAEVLTMSTFSKLSGINKFTVIGWVKSKPVVAGGACQLIDWTVNTANRVIVALYNNSDIYINICNGAIRFASIRIVDNNRWHHYAIVYNGEGAVDTDKLKLYIDGVQKTLSYIGPLPSSLPVQSPSLLIGKDAAAGVFSKEYIAKIFIDNTVFIQSQINSDYADFLNSTQTYKPTSGWIKPKPTSLNENGLVAAYNMTIQKGKVYDISGNNNTGTPSGRALSTLNGVNFNNTGVITIPTSPSLGVTTGLTIASRLLIRTQSGGAAEPGILSKSLNTYLLTFYEGDDKIYFYINTASNNIAIAIQKDVWFDVVATYDKIKMRLYINGVERITRDLTANINVDGAALTIGQFGSTALNGEISDMRIYNRAWSQSETTKYHNSRINVVLLEDFENSGADGVSTCPKGWSVNGAGNYKIIETISNDPVLKHIVKGTRSVYCTNIGGIVKPSQVAYGTWEFDYYRKIAGNNYVNLTATTRVPGGSGLYISLTSTNQIGIINTGDGYIMLSAANALTNGTRYRFKVTRDVTGKTTLYIKGGVYGNEYILVPVTTGTNPATSTLNTTSKFIIFDPYYSEEIGNIKITDGIII
jgi:hypothetical protein